MEIASEGVLVNRPLGAVTAIVTAANLDPTHRFGAFAQEREPAVILEANELAPLRIDHHIADESLGTGDGFDIEQAGPR